MPAPLPAARGHAALLGQAFWGAGCRQLPAQLSTSPPAARSTLLCLGGAGSPAGFLGTGALRVPLPEEKRSRQPGAVGRRLCRAERGRAGGEGQTTAPSRLLSSAPRAAGARRDAQRHAGHRHGEIGTAPRDGQGLDAWPWERRGARGIPTALKLHKRMWGAALPPWPWHGFWRGNALPWVFLPALGGARRKAEAGSHGPLGLPKAPSPSPAASVG